jgi:hypothetical protein
MEARIGNLHSALRLPPRVRLPPRARLPSVTGSPDTGRMDFRSRIRAAATDRVNWILVAVFVAGAAYYLWTAGTSYPLELNAAVTDPYNLLANAFLHFHVSVGRPPAGLLKLPEPYDPVANSFFQLHPTKIHDFALYHGKLYITWAPAPVIVLLVPMHLLGFEPCTSLTAAIFAITGLAFVLGALRVVLRQLGRVPLWMCASAALALTLSTVVPYILRRPEVYEETIAAGFCFAAIAVYLALSALLDRRTSLRRLAVMSLCFGLAVGSRPPLVFSAVVLLPVFLLLRRSRPDRGLLIALAAPIGVCLALLALYNVVRFGGPLDVGTKYALAGFNQYTAHFADPAYVAPGAWYYLASPPRLSILFPFVNLAPPPESYPGALPADYQAFELTGGLLPMAPIALFLGALPWIWRRRPNLLGRLGSPLLLLAGAGVAAVLFLSYEFYATTERYEVDFATLFLLPALAAWLALSVGLRGSGRRLAVRIGGALLVVWGCFAGLAVGFTGSSALLQINYPGTWSKLESLSSPLSVAATELLGRPVLAEVNAAKVIQMAPVTYTRLTAPTTAFGLAVNERAELTIVSPGSSTAVLTANLTPVVVTAGGASVSKNPIVLLVSGPRHASSSYTIPPGTAPGRIRLHLALGIDHVLLRVAPGPASAAEPAVPSAPKALVFANLSLSDG